MNDFDYEVKQKKDIARSAAHRVCGSKSSKCDLPSDRLTEAQKRALSGPVESYNLSGPMSWAEFKRMPEDLRKQYLTKLKNDFHASDAMLGRMFGVSEVTVNLHRNKLGVKSLGVSYQPTKAIKAAWEQYINPQSEPIVPEEPETAAEEPTPANTEPLAQVIVAPVPSQPATVYPLQQFTMDFTDIHTWEELYAMCKKFPEPGAGSFINIRVAVRG